MVGNRRVHPRGRIPSTLFLEKRLHPFNLDNRIDSRKILIFFRQTRCPDKANQKLREGCGMDRDPIRAETAWRRS